MNGKRRLGLILLLVATLAMLVLGALRWRHQFSTPADDTPASSAGAPVR